MARSRPHKYKRKTTTSVPQSTPATTSRIESTTGRTSAGTDIDRSKYRVRPRYKEDEPEGEFSTQSVAATSTAGIIGGVAKTVATAAKTVSTKITTPSVTKSAKKVGRRGIAPGVSAVAGVQEEKELPTASTSLFTGEVIPAHDDETYKRGPESLTDVEGLRNVLHGLTVPTQQMVQMGKDIMEGVPEEKRTMHESAIDLAIMPFLGPLIGQHEYGIGDQAYKPWEYGFADPRNLITDTFGHNIMTAGHVLQQPEYYDIVSDEMHQSSLKWERNKPYYMATTYGELPYFLIGLGTAQKTVSISAKAAAMGIRYSAGVKGPIARTIPKTDVGRMQLVQRADEIAHGVETSPRRFVEAIQRIKIPPPMAAEIQHDVSIGKTRMDLGQIRGDLRGPGGEYKTGYQIIPRPTAAEVDPITHRVISPGTSERWMHAQWGMRAPGKAVGTLESLPKFKAKQFLWRLRYGKQASERQLIEEFEKVMPIIGKGKDTPHYIVTETMGEFDIFHMPGAVQRSPMGIGRYVSDVETGIDRGKKTTYGTEVDEISLSDKGLRGIYENMQKFRDMGIDPTDPPTMPKGWLPSDTNMITTIREVGAHHELRLSPTHKIHPPRIDPKLPPDGAVDKPTITGGEYLKSTAALGMRKDAKSPEAYGVSGLAHDIIESLGEKAGLNIENALAIGRTTTGKALPAKRPVGVVQQGPAWATGQSKIADMLRQFEDAKIRNLRPKEWAGLRISLGGDTDEAVAKLSSIRRAMTPTGVVTDMGSILRKKGLKQYGVTEPIPGTPEAIQFNKLSQKIAEAQGDIASVHRETDIGHMGDVSWHEIMSSPADGRYGFLKKYFEPDLPPEKPSTPELTKLEIEFEDTLRTAGPETLQDTATFTSSTEEKLRRLGKQISVLKYGHETPQRTKISKPTLVSDSALTSARGRFNVALRTADPYTKDALLEKIVGTLPLHVQSKIVGKLKNIELYKTEQRSIVSKSPIVTAPESIIHKIDPSSFGITAKDAPIDYTFSPGIRVKHAGKGFPKDAFTIDIENVKDPSVKPDTAWISWMETEKSAKAQNLHVVDPKLKKKLLKVGEGEKKDIRWKPKFKILTPKTVRVIRGVQAKATESIDPFTASPAELRKYAILLRGSAEKDAEKTKIISMQYDDMEPLQQKQYKKEFGLRMSTYVTGEKTTTRSWRTFNLFGKAKGKGDEGIVRAPSRKWSKDSQKNIEVVEKIEGKTAFYFEKIPGLEGEEGITKIQRWLKTGSVTKQKAKSGKDKKQHADDIKLVDAGKPTGDLATKKNLKAFEDAKARIEKYNLPTSDSDNAARMNRILHARDSLGFGSGSMYAKRKQIESLTMKQTIERELQSEIVGEQLGFAESAALKKKLYQEDSGIFGKEGVIKDEMTQDYFGSVSYASSKASEKWDVFRISEISAKNIKKYDTTPIRHPTRIKTAKRKLQHEKDLITIATGKRTKEVAEAKNREKQFNRTDYQMTDAEINKIRKRNLKIQRKVKELRRQNRVGSDIPENENPLHNDPKYGVGKYKNAMEREVEFQRMLDEDLEDVTMGQQDARKWKSNKKKMAEADKEIKLIEGKLDDLKSAFEDDVKHREMGQPGSLGGIGDEGEAISGHQTTPWAALPGDDFIGPRRPPHLRPKLTDEEMVALSGSDDVDESLKTGISHIEQSERYGKPKKIAKPIKPGRADPEKVDRFWARYLLDMNKKTPDVEKTLLDRARFDETRRRLEYWLYPQGRENAETVGVLKGTDGKPVIDKKLAEDFESDYKVFSKGTRDVETKATPHSTLMDFLEARQHMIQSTLPTEKADITRRIKETIAKRVVLSDMLVEGKLDKAGNVMKINPEDPNFKLIQAHIDILDSNQTILQHKLGKLGITMDAYKRVKATQLLEETKQIYGAQPGAISQKVSELTSALSIARTIKRKIHTKQYRLEQRAIERIKKLDTPKNIEGDYHLDIVSRHPLKGDQGYIDSTTKEAQAKRIERAKTRHRRDSAIKDEMYTKGELENSITDQWRGYAKLNLERQLYLIKKHGASPQANQRDVLDQSAILISEINDLPGTYNRQYLKAIATSGKFDKVQLELVKAGKGTKSQIPSNVTETVEIGTMRHQVSGMTIPSKHTVVSPTKFVEQYPDYKEYLGNFDAEGLSVERKVLLELKKAELDSMPKTEEEWKASSIIRAKSSEVVANIKESEEKLKRLVKERDSDLARINTQVKEAQSVSLKKETGTSSFDYSHNITKDLEEALEVRHGGVKYKADLTGTKRVYASQAEVDERIAYLTKRIAQTKAGKNEAGDNLPPSLFVAQFKKHPSVNKETQLTSKMRKEGWYWDGKSAMLRIDKTGVEALETKLRSERKILSELDPKIKSSFGRRVRDPKEYVVDDAKRAAMEKEVADLLREKEFVVHNFKTETREVEAGIIKLKLIKNQTFDDWNANHMQQLADVEVELAGFKMTQAKIKPSKAQLRREKLEEQIKKLESEDEVWFNNLPKGKQEIKAQAKKEYEGDTRTLYQKYESKRNYKIENLKKQIEQADIKLEKNKYTGKMKQVKGERHYPQASDEHLVELPGNVIGTIADIDRAAAKSKNIKDVEIPKKHAISVEIDETLKSINKDIKINPKWRKYREDGTIPDESMYSRKLRSEKEIGDDQFASWHHRGGELRTSKKKSVDIELALGKLAADLKYLDDLPPHMKNFTMNQRGIQYTLTQDTLRNEIPPSRAESIIHIRDPKKKDEYVVKDGKWYKLENMDGRWTGKGPLPAVIALTDEEVMKVFPRPFQNLKNILKERRVKTVGALKRFEQRVGIQPSDAQVEAAIKKGDVVGYQVANTTIGKLLDHIGIRGGTHSRTGSQYTAQAWAEVSGKILEKFVDDLGKARERKLGTVDGAYQSSSAEARDFSRSFGQTQVYEQKYKLAQHMSEDDPSTPLPKGVNKDIVLEVTTPLPDTPHEQPVGMLSWLSRNVLGEPLQTPISMKEHLGLRDVYPIKGEKGQPDSLGYFTEDQKLAVRQHISYRYLRDVEKQQVYQSGDQKGTFVHPDVQKMYNRMTQDESVFLSADAREAIDSSLRTPTLWEKAGVLFGRSQERKGYINIFDVPLEGKKLAEGELSPLRRGQFELQHMPGISQMLQVEIYQNPTTLSKAQAMLRDVEVVAPHLLSKDEKQILKMKPVLTDYAVTVDRIENKMAEKLGPNWTGKRSWWEYDWDEAARRDPAYKPEAEERVRMKTLQDNIATQEHKKSILSAKQRELERKLGVTYDRTKKSLGKDAEWFTPTDGDSIKSYKGSVDDRAALQNVYLRRDETIKEIVENQNQLMGVYGSRTSKTGKYIHSILQDISPKPIRDADGKHVKKWTEETIINDKGEEEIVRVRDIEAEYEETPFSHFGKPGTVSHKSKLDAYFEWTQSDDYRGPTYREVTGKATPKSLVPRSGEKVTMKSTKQKDVVTKEGEVETVRLDETEYTAISSGKRIPTIQTPAGARHIPTKYVSRRGMRETSEKRPYGHPSTYDPTHVSVIDDIETSLGYEIGKLSITAKRAKELKKIVESKKLTDDGVKNTEKNIKQGQEDLEKLLKEDPGHGSNTASRLRKRLYDEKVKATIDSLRREINVLGTNKNITTKTNTFKHVTYSDVEKGSYTVESGKQSTVMMDKPQTSQLGAPHVVPIDLSTPVPPLPTRRIYQDVRSISESPGITVTSTHGTIPSAEATPDIRQTTVPVAVVTPSVVRPELETESPRISGPQIIVPRIAPDTTSVRDFLKESSNTISSTVIDLSTRTDTASMLQTKLIPGVGLIAKEKAIVREKVIEKQKLRIPEILKQRGQLRHDEPLRRVIPPPRVRPIPLIAFAWLDPAQRKKKEAMLKKKKKKKIAWAAPKVWFQGEGYYFKGGQSYVSFTKKEPRKITRLDKKLGEQKWSESRTPSMFDVRPVKGRKVNPYRQDIGYKPQKKKRQPKRTDMFGSTSTRKKGY